MPRTVPRIHFRALVVFAAVAVVVMMGLVEPVSAIGGTSIDSAGPLTKILVGTDTQCQVFHAGDVEPEFFGFPDSGACGTFVALAGVLYGPEVVPAGGSAAPRTTFTPVSQSAVTGSGTEASPFSLTTVVDLGATGFRLTETDTYVLGQEAYLTTVALANNTASPQSAVIYRAGDCFLQNSDFGFGQVNGKAVGCRSTQSARIEQWLPVTPGSTYMENGFDTVWAAIGSQQPFANTCLCGTAPGDEHDNGAGLSWVVTIGAGQTVSVSQFTIFSPLGVQPLTVTKTADIARVAAGESDGYTVSITNPAAFEVVLDNVTDVLPAGFSYVPGSTSQGLTSDPTISGQTLTWVGPIPVPGSSTLTFHFSVTVSAMPGIYTNSANAAGAGLVVTGADNVAAVEVIEPAPTPPPTGATPVLARPAFTG